MSALNPYSDLLPHQFWRQGVVEDHVLLTNVLWQKKFAIDPDDKIACAGSCFAQHISKRLKLSGYQFVDFEVAPRALPVEFHKKYGYSMYSARYGNIYTVAQLLEVAQEAFGIRSAVGYSWVKDGRYYDPLRPGVEPNGLDSPEEVDLLRRYHLERVRELLSAMDVFVFTLGLTEAWVCKRSGRTLPVAPGVIAGSYNPQDYEFKNFSHAEIKSQFVEFMKLVESVKGCKCRFIISVSPVPLTATASGRHVLVATNYSKGTLLSVASELCSECDEVDYFPSYEVISSPWSRGIFFASNQRDVSPAGVDAVMRVFFQQHKVRDDVVSGELIVAQNESSELYDDVLCEEALLEQFSA